MGDERQKIKARIQKLTVLTVGALLFLILLLDVKGNYRLEAVDAALSGAVQSMQCPFLTGFFRVVNNLVHPLVMLIISMMMIHILRQRKY